MNLHDWIDELCGALDVETEVDERLLIALSDLTRYNVALAAGPVTTYLLGYAAGAVGADPAAVGGLAARAQELAERWDEPVLADPGDPADDEVELDFGTTNDIPDDDPDDDDPDDDDSEDEE